MLFPSRCPLCRAPGFPPADRNCEGRFFSQGQCPLQVVVFEGTRHAVGLGSARAECFRGVAPARGYGRDFPDDDASLRRRQREELGSGLQQIERTGALAEIDVGRQDPRLEVRGYGIEVLAHVGTFAKCRPATS